MTIRHKLFSPNTVLAADDLTDVANNGVVSIGTTADLDNPDTANVNVVYVQSETKLRVRKSAGLGVAHWSSPFDSTVPENYATVSKTGYGQFTISNYIAEQFYDATQTVGTVVVTGAVITSTGATNTVITLNARSSYDGEPKQIAIERKAYTYHTSSSTSCTDNCRIAYDCVGSPYPGCTPCQGDGYNSGGVCCGGSAGQTCTTTNTQVKDSTPSGYTDQNGEWWKSWEI